MIETQIVLAIVGALIMLVVGASLARAFGIAGAANLIRYRAKIEDPKDAVVMLSALPVGLASGVGLFGIAGIGTLFLVFTLWIIEGFETHVRTFLLSLKLGERTSERRAAVERILQRAGTVFELRTTADDELVYLVNAGASLKTEQLSAAVAALAPKEETRSARNLGGERKSGGVLQIKEKGALVQEARLNDVSQVNVFGSASVTSGAVQALSELERPIAHFTMGGWFYAMTAGLPWMSS